MKKIWECKIGECDHDKLPCSAGLPMRTAIAEAYKRITGEDCLFLFSGWGAELDEYERAVVNNK